MYHRRILMTWAVWVFCVTCAFGHFSGQQEEPAVDTTRLRTDLEQGALLAKEGRAEEAEELLLSVRARAVAGALPLWQARADRHLGRMHFMSGKDSSGTVLLERAADACNDAGAHHEASLILAELGWREGRAGSRVQGIERLRNARSALLVMGDPLGAAYCMQKEADIYADAGQFSTAIGLFTEAAAIEEHANDPHLGMTLCELSHALGCTGDDTGALATAEQAIEVLGAANDARGVSYAHVLKADALNELGRYQEALSAAQRSERIFDRHYGVCDAYMAEGIALLNLNRPKEALGRFNEARSLASEAGNMALALSLEEMIAKAAAATGDHRLAYEKLQHYYDFMKSCGMLDASNDIARMEMEHEFTTRHLTDSLELAKRQAIAIRDNELRLSRERNTRNLIIAGAAVAILVAIGLWLRLRHLRRTRDMILRTQVQLVQSEKRREAEEVRTRIARDMHDEIGSDLTKIGLVAAQARGQEEEAMSEIAGLASRVRGSLNDIVWAVDPRHDSVRALVIHAEQYTQRMLDNHTARHELRFELNGTDRAIDPARKRNIFLLLKEALNNAVKYASAERVQVSLGISDAAFELCVSDNGIGFDPNMRGREGNGLRNMRSRAEALGAVFEIISTPGSGCSVRVSGPLA